MRQTLFILSAMASAVAAQTQDVESDYEYIVPELPVIQLCAVEKESQKPIPSATISLEYVDTIMISSTDSMGLLDFTPRSFPFTLTAKCQGMLEATYGIMEQPDGPLTILMTREPSKN